jgi:hypothetical protein
MPPQQAFVSQKTIAASDNPQPVHHGPPDKNLSFGALGANLAAMKKTLHSVLGSNHF